MKKRVETEFNDSNRTFSSKQAMKEHRSCVNTSQIDKYYRFCKKIFLC